MSNRTLPTPVANPPHGGRPPFASGPTVPPGSLPPPAQRPTPTAPQAPHFPAGFTKQVAEAIQNYLKTPGAESARGIIMNFLNQFGLGSLANWAWGRYLQLGGGSDAIQEIQFELPQQKAFQQRFPAYEKLAKEGHVMSPADMISLENSYSQALHSAGLPPGFYDSPNDFAQFMLNNVSPSELSQRAQLASSLVMGDPEAIQQAARFGISAGHQIAWILDPTRALPLIQQTVLAAQDAAAAHETGFGQLSRAQGTLLARQGVTADAARSGFTQLATQAGLMQGTAAEGSDISADQQIAAEFQGNAFAQLRIQNRQAQRLADYKGSGGFNAQQQGVVGLGQQTGA